MNYLVNSEFMSHQNLYAVRKISDLVSPSDVFIFLDVRLDSIWDSTFLVDLGRDGPITAGNIPADYHNRSGNLCFGDGHVENHRWIDPRTRPPIRDHQFTALVLLQGTPNADVVWLENHNKAFNDDTGPLY
jgi:prepilin-type processing-associated H-X9-DG protein